MANRELSPRRLITPTHTYDEKKAKLNDVYQHMTDTILKFQSPTTGLFPLETTDKCKIADIRTSIYCALSIWSLHLSYRKILNDDGGRTYLLSQTAVKTMRGILSCWMYQIPKLKKFTTDQRPENALHLRFDLKTGEVLDNDDNYPHLQLDCISLYLISLVQMIASGLQIIYTCDEVDFIQNLVFCIERAYRIADFGMWERGSKYNNGTPELNASSVGMAKAAMEAVNGFNLFGEHGASWTVIYVDIDAHMRNRIVFENLIPRESSSKMTDAALLPVLTWPCFAVHDAKVKDSAIQTIIGSLKRGYGFKRFHRDGYGTVFEDPNRQYYNPYEIKVFDGIECEWPFLTFFLVINCMFNGDVEGAYHYLEEIKPHLKSSEKGYIIPKYYYVPKNLLTKERQADDGGFSRLPSGENPKDECYFLWGQSVYLVMHILVENLLAVNELDPIKRYLSASERPRFSHRYMSFEASHKDRLVQVSIIAESMRLQQTLAVHGILSQTPTQVEPLQIWSPNQLMKVLKYMGVNYKLGLNGRPSRPVGLIGTSMFYRVCGQTIISYPLLFEVNDFYISQDLNSVIDEVQHDLMILSTTWKLSGRPTYLIMVNENMVQSPHAKDLINFLSSFRSGVTSEGVRVKLDRLQSMVSSSTKEHLDFFIHISDYGMEGVPFVKIEEKLHDQLTQIKVNFTGACPYKKTTSLEHIRSHPDWKLLELYRSTDDICVQSNTLKVILEKHDNDRLYRVDGQTIDELLEKLRIKATQSACPDWQVVRLCSALTHKLVDSLAPSITNILVRGKLITLGVFGHEERVLNKPLNPTAIGSLLYELCLSVEPCEAVLQQELILILGKLHSTSPQLFNGILKIRVGWIIHAMQYALSYDTPGRTIFSLSPSEIYDLLNKILLHTRESEKCKSHLWRRCLLGSLGAVPNNFYEKMWYILERTPGGVSVNGHHIPQQPTLSDLTVQEMNFALVVEEMLSVVDDPVHRQIVVEILNVAGIILERNREVNFSQVIDISQIMDKLLKLFKNSHAKLSTSSDDEVMKEFYNTAPTGSSGTYSYIAKAVCSTLLEGSIQSGTEADDCILM